MSEQDFLEGFEGTAALRFCQLFAEVSRLVNLEVNEPEEAAAETFQEPWVALECYFAAGVCMRLAPPVRLTAVFARHIPVRNGEQMRTGRFRPHTFQDLGKADSATCLIVFIQKGYQTLPSQTYIWYTKTQSE